MLCRKLGKEDAMEFDFERISALCQVKRIGAADFPAVLELFQGNPLFYEHLHSVPTEESVAQDLKALPPGKGYEDKYYVGLYREGALTAVLDLILRYPNAETAFIGLFMVRRGCQGRGVGSFLIGELTAYLKAAGFSAVRLGCVKSNPQSRRFWLKNGFSPTGVETDWDGCAIVVMERRLGEEKNGNSF